MYVNEDTNIEISPDAYSTNNCVHNSRLSVPLQPQMVLDEQPRWMAIPETMMAVHISATPRAGGMESLVEDVRSSGTDVPMFFQEAALTTALPIRPP
jgi:hypothetical protein